LHAKDEVVKDRLVGFAGEKLLNGVVPEGPLKLEQELACLSQRMPIEFYSSAYTTRRQEQQQVESHMRVCLKVMPGFENMVTAAPSEPILSEAASNIMSNPNFNAPKALQRVLGGFSVHRGDRGEFVAMLLFTLSRDHAILSRPSSAMNHRVIFVNDFLKSLFRPSEKMLSMLPSVAHPKEFKSSLSVAFSDARLHFNHFIKVHQHRIINRKYLLKLMTRGAAVLCGNSQAGVDGVIPVVFQGSRLEVHNGSAILWQSKAGGNYNHEPVPALFDSMDPHELGIFDRTDGLADTPIIRIIFALAAEKPSITFLPPRTTEGSYKAYDIWCSGVSSNLLASIKKEAEETWESLVAASHGWQDLYDVGHRQMRALQMSMNPGAALYIGIAAWNAI